MNARLEKDKSAVQFELDKLTAELGESALPTLAPEEIVATFCESWQRLTDTEKRRFLTKYVKKIVVRNDPVEGTHYGKASVVRVEFN